MSRPSAPGAPEGVLLIDKPTGWTSHDVVAKIRRLTGQRRAGHTGTLDPAATGLLVLCLGRATRLVEFMTGHDKTYTGVVALGLRTTTDDAEGEVVETRPVPTLTDADLRGIEGRFHGRLAQVPPAYSAVKIEGRRAYALARQGAEPDLPTRSVVIHALELRLAARERLALRVHCGAGTYVRALARDIGEALGCGAHLATLRRTAVGPFGIDCAWSIEDVATAGARGNIERLLLAMDDGCADLPAILLAADRAERLARGEVLPPACPAWRTADPARVYDANGEFVGIGEVSASGAIRGRKVIA